MNDTDKPSEKAAAGPPLLAAPSVANSQRGLLDLSVELSTRDVTAGDEFTLFVLVRNPFPQAVWISRVHLSLPSELAHPLKSDFERDLRARFDETVENLNRSRSEIRGQLDSIDTKLSELREITTADDDRSAGLSKMVGLFEQIKARLGTPKATIGAKFWIFDIKSSSDLTTEQIGELSETLKKRDINLETSLPAGSALQPSSTAVYTAILNVKRPLFRPPSKFKLQISVIYSFEETRASVNKFTNTISYEIAIRPALRSLLFGASFGSAFGCIARYLQGGAFKLELVDWSSSISVLLAIVLSVLLSAIAIIFMARKTDAQPFVSVEDFWGGVLIGFLVGYTGTSFFHEVVNIEGFTPPS